MISFWGVEHGDVSKSYVGGGVWRPATDLARSGGKDAVRAQIQNSKRARTSGAPPANRSFLYPGSTDQRGTLRQAAQRYAYLKKTGKTNPIPGVRTDLFGRPSGISEDAFKIKRAGERLSGDPLIRTRNDSTKRRPNLP